MAWNSVRSCLRGSGSNRRKGNDLWLGTANESPGPQSYRRVRIPLWVELHLREHMEQCTDDNLVHVCRTVTITMKSHILIIVYD